MELIREIASSPSKQVIIALIAIMARELGVDVIAEGVEMEAEMLTLQSAGFDLVQSYLL